MKRFLSALFAPYDADDALRLEIRCLAPQWDADRPRPWPRQWYCLCPTYLDNAAIACAGWSKRWEVYFGVLPRVGETGTQNDVFASSFLWCDVDGGDGGVDGAVRLVKKSNLPLPHFAVVSGGGLHLYYRLSETVSLPDKEERLRFKQTLQRLCRAIGGESPNAHADTSACEVARVLRVPGTYNLKRKDEPRRVWQTHFQPEAEAHTLTWWEATLPALPVLIPRKPLYTVQPTAEYGEGLLRWARRPFPQGQRHKDLVAAAAWLVRTEGLAKPLAEELLLLKAQASPGLRSISEDEIREMIQWA